MYIHANSDAGEFPGIRIKNNKKLNQLYHAHFAHFFHKPFARGGFFLFAHNTGLFIMLPFFHFGKNTGFFDLFLETAQGYVKIIIFFVQKYTWQKNHPLRLYRIWIFNFLPFFINMQEKNHLSFNPLSDSGLPCSTGRKDFYKFFSSRFEFFWGAVEAGGVIKDFWPGVISCTWGGSFFTVSWAAHPPRNIKAIKKAYTILHIKMFSRLEKSIEIV